MAAPDRAPGGAAAVPDGGGADPLPTGRGVELLLLGFAAVLVTSALVLVQANQERELSSTLLYLGAAYLALFTGAHLAVRRFAPFADPLILPCVALLNGLGLVVIRRLDFADAERAAAAGEAAPRADAPLQLIWTAIGVVAFVAVLAVVRDHTRLRRYTYTAAAAGLVALLLPALPLLGREINLSLIHI